MKKLLFIFMLLLFPVFTYASSNYEIEAVYITSDLDFFGSMHVKEGIVVKGQIDSFKRVIYFKDKSLGEWEDGNEINFEASAIYNGRSGSLNKISAFKVEEDEIGWTILSKYENEFEEKETVETGIDGVYTAKKLDGGIELEVYNKNDSGYMVYYFDYYIDQVVAVHNDVAELYWRFIPTDFPGVKNAHIQITTPGTTSHDLFKFWAHGPLTGEIAGISNEKDDDDNYLYRGVQVNVTDVKKGQGLDVRFTFNKSLVAMVAEMLDNSGVDALEKITEVENNRLKSANQNRIYVSIVKYGIIVLSGLYIIGLIVISIIYKKKNKKDNSKTKKLIASMYIILGAIIIGFMFLFNLVYVPLIIGVGVTSLIYIIYIDIINK